jgi:hypothetical protein
LYRYLKSIIAIIPKIYKTKQKEESATKSEVILIMATDGTKSNPKGMTNERIFETFQTLRKEQLHVGNKIAQLESDLHEHK